MTELESDLSKLTVGDNQAAAGATESKTKKAVPPPKVDGPKKQGTVKWFDRWAPDLSWREAC